MTQSNVTEPELLDLIVGHETSAWCVPAPKRRAADVLVEVLADAGVEIIFGIPGGVLVALNDALLDRPEIRTVTAHHENGAVFAACAYARATGKVGVAMVTSGPGVLNAMTGLASAYCDGLPVLLIAGEVPRPLFGKGALQEGSANHLNIVGMTEHITKMSTQVVDPNAGPSVLRKAMATALSGRPGPVLVSVPMDVTTAMIRSPELSLADELEPRLDDAALGKVARLLEGARRPAMFVGSGARWGTGPQMLRALAEKLQLPVITTPKAKGVFPERHPLSVGVFGYGGNPSASRLLEGGVDVLLAVGTGFSDPATNSWSPLLQPSEHLIQIDVDAAQIGRNYPVSLGIVGPAAQALRGISEHVRPHAGPRRAFAVETFGDPQAQAPSAPGLVSPIRALWELQRALPRNTIFQCDVGEHLLFAIHYLRIDDPESFVIMMGLSSMGSAIGGAIGTKLAHPERPVVAICGDGCLAMSAGEIGTAAREGLPIVVAVFNDRRLGMVELGHGAIYGRTPSFRCKEIDVCALGRGLGADVAVVDGPDQLSRLGLEGRRSNKPIVLDIRIDPSVTMPKNKRFQELAAATRPGKA